MGRIGSYRFNLQLNPYLDTIIWNLLCDQAADPKSLVESLHAKDTLLAFSFHRGLRGYEVHYDQFVGGHDGLSRRGTLADGLITLMERPQDRE